MTGVFGRDEPNSEMTAWNLGDGRLSSQAMPRTVGDGKLVTYDDRILCDGDPILGDNEPEMIRNLVNTALFILYLQEAISLNNNKKLLKRYVWCRFLALAPEKFATDPPFGLSDGGGGNALFSINFPKSPKITPYVI